MYDAIRVLIARDPTLLHIENAMGMTPCELVLASHLREAHARARHQPVTIDLPVDTSDNEVVLATPNAGRLWELVHVEAALPAKRKLCALAEANELAKRVWYQARVSTEAEAKGEQEDGEGSEEE